MIEDEKVILITFKEAEEALDRLRKKYGHLYNPTNKEIFDEALKQ